MLERQEQSHGEAWREPPTRGWAVRRPFSTGKPKRVAEIAQAAGMGWNLKVMLAVGLEQSGRGRRPGTQGQAGLAATGLAGTLQLPSPCTESLNKCLLPLPLATLLPCLEYASPLRSHVLILPYLQNAAQVSHLHTPAPV